MSTPKYILTDIEGTTTSVSFVYDVLFPYFRENINKVKDLTHLPEVIEIFDQTKTLTNELDGVNLLSTEEIIAQLTKWSIEDKKITPLKTLQGILWKEAYESGLIKGHVYPDVANALINWKKNNIELGVFSSGSVTAQKLIFGFSEAGDLTPYFSNYFDTNTGGKRDTETYFKIASLIGKKPSDILFLSDIVEELEAADKAGFQTIQLVRPGTTANWTRTAYSFSDISLDIMQSFSN
jgi:enolase-phosphatase E1